MENPAQGSADTVMAAEDKELLTIVPGERPAEGYHLTQQGEWISKLAAQYGIADWRRIWNHPKNAELREKRKEPNVLYPGDLVFIPELEIRQENCVTDKRHRFQLKSTREKLKLVLKDWEHKPRRGVVCALEIHGRVWGKATKTNEQGKIEFEIPEAVSAARLLVGEKRLEVYQVRVGHLDPMDEVSGYQQRLSNLGYYSGKIDGSDGPLTKRAIRLFQDHENFMAKSQVLEVDGIMGPKTKARLEERHGY